MTSLLAFAWRKANMPTYSTTNTSSSSVHSSLNGKTSSSQQPDLRATASSGSLTAPGSSDSLFEPPVSSCLDGPNTPEALRGRQTAREIREDLGLAPKCLEWRFQDRDGDKLQEVYSEQNFEDRRIGKSPPRSPISYAALPPLFGGYGAPSPQISTSSLYSRTSRSHKQVASSPNLSVGQAKTAVGALVAMTETRALQPPSATKGKRKNYNQEDYLVPLHNEHSILPPRHWLDDERTLEEAQDFSIELPYEPLNESKVPLSPVSRRTLTDDESSIHGSPSSNQRGLQKSSNLPETSFTRGFLQAESSFSSNAERPYDFNSIVDKEFVVAEAQASGMNMSAISQGTGQDQESLHSLPSPEDLAIVAFEKPRKQTKEYISSYQDQNERRVKEDMLLSTLERLQDDNEFVLEIMEACKDSRLGTVNLEPDNFFSGFHQSQRDKILQDLDRRIIDQQSQTNRQRGEELVASLSFCRSLVRAAIPLQEKMEKAQCAITGVPQQGHRWKRVDGFRALLGFNEEPKSPETVRGGDTSLFSLPSDSAHDATPHTSNVSMTSTITSAVTPDKHSENRLGSANRRDELRQAIETACILFDKLGTQVKNLSETKPSSTPLVIREIESLCSRLLKIPTEALRGLIDSFELDLLSLGISRMVSEDQGDNYQDILLKSEIASPEPNISAGQLLISQTMGMSLNTLDMNLIDETNQEREEGDNLFSPSSEDMRSIEQTASTSPYDDLRRTVGSFDRNDDVEERDASPAYVPLADEEAPAKKAKPRRSIFRRRIFRRRRAAE